MYNCFGGGGSKLAGSSNLHYKNITLSWGVVSSLNWGGGSLPPPRGVKNITDVDLLEQSLHYGFLSSLPLEALSKFLNPRRLTDMKKQQGTDRGLGLYIFTHRPALF